MDSFVLEEDDDDILRLNDMTHKTLDRLVAGDKERSENKDNVNEIKRFLPHSSILSFDASPSEPKLSVCHKVVDGKVFYFGLSPKRVKFSTDVLDYSSDENDNSYEQRYVHNNTETRMSQNYLVHSQKTCRLKTDLKNPLIMLTLLIRFID